MTADRFLQSVRMSLQSLMLHKLRSVLTVSGIVLGVASVIVMLSIGEAARFEAVEQIKKLGATNIIVRSVKPQDDGKDSRDSFILTYGITRADVERLRSTLPTIRGVTPQREFRKEVRVRERLVEVHVVGATPAYQAMNGLKLSAGRFITQTDEDRLDNVAVLGTETALALFPLEDPIGKSISIDEKYYYRVIGIADKRSATGKGTAGGLDTDRDIYIPFATDRARNGAVLFFFKSGSITYERLEVSQITVEIDDIKNVQKTAHLIRETLLQFHPRKDFDLTVPLDLLERAEKTQQVFTLVLGAIGSISLIVGGIGIMNIMLATVTERTREIGIRRALGAKRRDIVWQFLIETLTLSGLGGLLGVGLGIAISTLVTYSLDFPTILQYWSIFLAFGVSLIVGLIFGTYPAVRASRLDPIVALRHN